LVTRNNSISTIAYRDGVIASDSLVMCGHIRAGYTKKITKTSEGYLLGAAGSLADLNKFFDVFEANQSEDIVFSKDMDFDNFEGMIVTPKGKVYIVENSGYPFHIEADYYAVGSGTELAKGAMAMGASSVDAVKVAIELSNESGGKVNVERLNKGWDK